MQPLRSPRPRRHLQPSVSPAAAVSRGDLRGGTWSRDPGSPEGARTGPSARRRRRQVEAHRGRGRSCETGSVFLSASLSLGPVLVTRGRSEVACFLVSHREPPLSSSWGAGLQRLPAHALQPPSRGDGRYHPTRPVAGFASSSQAAVLPAYLGPGTATGQGTLQMDHPGGPQRGPRRGWGPGRRAGKPGAVRWEGTRETSVACCGPRGGTWGWVACHGESPDPASSWKGVGSWRWS